MRLPNQELITLILDQIAEAAHEIVRQKTLQKKIEYISEATTSKVNSTYIQALEIVRKRTAHVQSFTDSILQTLEQKIDNISPHEVLYLMDLLNKALSNWNLTEEEAKAIIKDLKNTSFPLD